ncbi:class I SAM-dependent methyltransferase [Fictibacillus sp. S7]|uniref:class I SAM-dependent methyltransferase n=1 Tax=Fictibacillus sp. S7 TaxID=2212476 RepID=UPI001012B02D|nr:class I SAM-dependent methyltransferase [Fictibacillus sp. S7]RXZ02148.1 SAM-dependent methyltransferase [Fictibacillus sp. S7]
MDERRFNPDNKELLDTPERRKLLPPEKLLGLLPFKNNDEVLDLGAGTGYFSIPASKLTNGSVYALDIDTGLLEVIHSHIKEQGISNIQLLEGKVQNLPLSDSTIDIVIASLVLHAVDPLSEGMSEIKRVMKTGAYLLCFDWEKIESRLGPPLDIRIPSSEMEKSLADGGFKIIKKVFPVDFLYIFVAQKA